VVTNQLIRRQNKVSKSGSGLRCRFVDVYSVMQSTA